MGRRSMVQEWLFWQIGRWDVPLAVFLLCMAVIVAILARPVHRPLILFLILIHSTLVVFGPVLDWMDWLKPPAYLDLQEVHFVAIEAIYLLLFTVTASMASYLFPPPDTRLVLGRMAPSILVPWIAALSIAGLLLSTGITWDPYFYLLLPLLASLTIFQSGGRPGKLGWLFIMIGCMACLVVKRHSAGMYVLMVLASLLAVFELECPAHGGFIGRIRQRLILPGLILGLAMGLFLFGTLVKYGDDGDWNQLKGRLLFSQSGGHAALVQSYVQPGSRPGVESPDAWHYYAGLLPGRPRTVNLGEVTYIASRPTQTAKIRWAEGRIPYLSSSPSAEFLFVGGLPLLLAGSVASGLAFAMAVGVQTTAIRRPWVQVMATAVIITFLGVGNSMSYSKLSFLIELVILGMPFILLASLKEIGRQRATVRLSSIHMVLLGQAGESLAPVVRSSRHEPDGDH